MSVHRKWPDGSVLAFLQRHFCTCSRIVVEINGKGAMTRILLVAAVMSLLSLDPKPDTQERLAARRAQIDSLDQRIVQLVQERARVVEEVGKIKREAHLPVAVPSREQEVIEKVQELAKGGPLPPEAVGRIYQKLAEEMRNWEAKLDAATE
jgi:chorismate mutase